MERAKKKKKLAEHDYAKKSHLLLSHERMNRHQLDFGLCKHKKIGRENYSVFRAYEARTELKYTHIKQSNK